MTEMSGAYDGGAVGVMSGLVMGTKVATAMGWRAVEAIDRGDEVMTFDMGLQPVTKVSRKRIWNGQTACPPRFWPLEVPAGALDNRQVMQVLPQQNVMVESDAAEEIYGDPFMLMPAISLDGVRGIHRVPPKGDLEIVTLHFEEEQVIFTGNGALFFCPSSRDLLLRAMDDTAESPYAVLSIEEARALAKTIADELAACVTQVPPQRAPACAM